MRKLVFTHGQNFARQFSPGDLQALKTRLGAYSNSPAFTGRGITTDVAFVDDAHSCPPGIQPAPASGAQCADIKRVVDAIATQANPTYDLFLIIGGHSIVPFFEYPNPVSGDSDLTVPSDNFYAIPGDIPDGQQFFPERALTRLPTGSDPTPDVLYQALDEAEAALPRPPGSGGSSCLAAADWQQVTLKMAQSLGIAQADFHPSPPIDLSGSPNNFNPAWLDNRAVHFFNVHGDSNSPDWFGQSGSYYPTAYAPPVIAAPVPQVEHAIVGTEACYGADIIGTNACQRSISTALSLKYLSAKALGFCGSTTIAYGATDQNPTLCAADLLVSYFLSAIQGGKALGPALLLAKNQLAVYVEQQLGAPDSTTEKTLLQFVAYGDPGVASFLPSAAKAPNLGDRVLSAVRDGGLGVTFRSPMRAISSKVLDGTETRSLVSGSPPLPEFVRKRGARLVSLNRRQLSWDLSEHRGMIQTFSAKLAVPATSFVAPPPQAVWDTEVYILETKQGGDSQFYVRTIQRGPEPRVLTEAVSRGGTRCQRSKPSDTVSKHRR